ncbi:MAG: tetratricopeptide repeat protein [bacterium]|jgi:tetratricopeptide (TPR) repeat protein|nr:tetratricopeptide repeat protein [bacterium]
MALFPLPLSRRVIYWLLACVGVPLLFLVGLEIGLRLAGVGYPTSFWIQKTVQERPVWIPNWQFGWRFFPKKIARKPEAVVIPAKEVNDVYRIVVLGESAAQGDPQPEYGFSRMLQVMLEAHYPGTRFEVINAAMTGINSFAVRDIAQDSLCLQPDLFVIYMGNNEVVGPFGAGNVLKRFPTPLWMIRTHLAFQTTSLGQGMAALLGARDSGDPDTWMGMKMFDDLVRWESEPLQRIYSNFRTNLHSMLVRARCANTRYILCTVGVNLRDCAPFGAIHGEGMSVDTLLEWNALWEEAVQLETQGKVAEALDLYLALEELDARHAGVQFHIAQLLLATQNPSAAAKRFTRARDLDALRFRADSRINEMIREAAEFDSNTTLVDFERVLQEASEHGIAGSAHFYEHVHLNPQGNYLLAQTVLDSLEAMLPGDIQNAKIDPMLAFDEVLQQLAYTDWNAYQVLQTLAERINEPPFLYQSNHQEQQVFLQQAMRQLMETPQAEAMAQALEIYKNALDAKPNDSAIRSNYAGLLVAMGQIDEGLEVYRGLLRENPFDPTVPVRMGDAYTKQQKTDDAVTMYDLALTIRPDYNRAMYYKGISLANGGRIHEAIRLFEEFLVLYPDHGHGHVNLALLYKNQNQPEKAMAHLETALRLNRRDKLALNHYGVALAEQGKLEEALQHFKAALRIDPAFMAARKNFSMAIQKLNTATP